MAFDATNRKDIRNAEKRDKLNETNRIAFIRTIMSTIGGREWMHGQLTKCYIFHSPYVKGDPHATAFNCGAQNIGLQTFADVVSQCPTEYALMMQEAQIKDDADAARRNDDNAYPTLRADTGYDIDTAGFVVHDDSGTSPDDDTATVN